MDPTLQDYPGYFKQNILQDNIHKNSHTRTYQSSDHWPKVLQHVFSLKKNRFAQLFDLFHPHDPHDPFLARRPMFLIERS